MEDKKILTVQDISCVGQCSLTVALPIISACGIETCVLPSAVLSTHTGGFKGYTFRDLTDDIPDIVKHWKSEGISFNAIYTGYLGSIEQIDMVCDIMKTVASKECIKVVDPAMADNGKLYPGFDMGFVQAMKKLCGGADYLLPNITEASFLAGVEYKNEYDKNYILKLIDKLLELGCNNVILTGVSYEAGKTGVVVYMNGEYSYYEHEKIAGGCHGTGDIYSSAFVGALMNDIDAYSAAKIAADYVTDCIRETMKLDNHWYGAKFEPVLHKLYNRINENRCKLI
ncbi:MAG: pyridoxamine kinase [Lachnospiraceae bacterium]|nr:pyridoxamine kinase [Lachnospiraceae bacterium]